MAIKDHKNENSEEEKTKGTAKEKASFDQNGKGASEKFGQAGNTPNESGDENGAGTANKKGSK
ncbi:hypothetical protein EZ449_21835 [Pedobacter frigidisoli]|uniref:Uncharacterized protein n=1 Tax=Pedobacter frigidisoli TaxID=2530455 RepID=A0A4V2MKG5_9SPHI|nr:hypothetical protein [Pedobacter frigidisoli]TCC98096.1 hypothetical protein EZ449_21835 [Pedobacter frigidisoli]